MKKQIKTDLFRLILLVITALSYFRVGYVVARNIWYNNGYDVGKLCQRVYNAREKESDILWYSKYDELYDNLYCRKGRDEVM